MCGSSFFFHISYAQIKILIMLCLILGVFLASRPNLECNPMQIWDADATSFRQWYEVLDVLSLKKALQSFG